MATSGAQLALVMILPRKAKGERPAVSSRPSGQQRHHATRLILGRQFWRCHPSPNVTQGTALPAEFTDAGDAGNRRARWCQIFGGRQWTIATSRKGRRYQWILSRRARSPRGWKRLA